MQTFQVFSQKANCNLQFKYGNNGRLLAIEFVLDDLNIDEQLRLQIVANAPSSVGTLKQLAQKHNWKLIEVLEDITFESFWNKYNYKVGKLNKTKEYWNKLSDADKTLAFKYIDKYNNHLKLSNVSKAYPTSYLNGQYWLAG